ncbi:KEOPS complex subunit Pcc1 [Halospeciosus flavus]|uniref:KEOPS complex subunit Pcc1 n=1 Tax=Halospeciosus flavus TaxID=3032283 RepID=A0ABD5Z403_9EURY|nr:KEOPS complex subunit Pcc1 [Halospeciosus flavus]
MSRRHATIRTTVDDPELVAAALRPDNTSEMDTTVEDDAVVTTIERDTTGGLRTTTDDYVVNLTVANEIVQQADNFTQSNHE